ncbi:MAG: hypothetical protein ACJA2E_000505, partial [Arenicella sp.]
AFFSLVSRPEISRAKNEVIVITLALASGFIKPEKP